MEFAAWPSWRINTYDLHPETGLVTSQELGISVPGIAWARSYGNGEFRTVYANRFAGSGSNTICPVNPDTLVVDIANPVVESADVGGFIMNKFVLNRVDHLVALGDVQNIRIYNYNTQTLLGRITVSELFVNDMGFESNELAWATVGAAMSDTALVKFNYKTMKPESISILQPGALSDLNTGVAYDSKRKMVGVFRQHEEATDGAATHTLDIYKPFMVATNLTDPVPIQKVVKGETATMIAHLIGDRGEVGQVKPITVTNSGDGTILQSTVSPRGNGSISFQYLAGDNPGSDTITLQVDI
jgi:hypothetical protein